MVNLMRVKLLMIMLEISVKVSKIFKMICSIKKKMLKLSIMI